MEVDIGHCRWKHIALLCSLITDLTGVFTTLTVKRKCLNPPFPKEISLLTVENDQLTLTLCNIWQFSFFKNWLKLWLFWIQGTTNLYSCDKPNAPKLSWGDQLFHGPYMDPLGLRGLSTEFTITRCTMFQSGDKCCLWSVFVFLFPGTDTHYSPKGGSQH